jgi:hypothetical protein
MLAEKTIEVDVIPTGAAVGAEIRGVDLAVKDYELPQRRLMHRVTVNGSVPF